jgi:hypothetical protein
MKVRTFRHVLNTAPRKLSRFSDSLGQEGPGIESRWGEILRTYPDRLRGPPSLLYNGYRVFPGGKGGRGVMLTTHPPSSAEVRKELSYTSTHPMGPPAPVTGLPLPLPFTQYCEEPLLASLCLSIRKE